ncbi:hypothetical protein VUR80DRAFT_1375 [Thermomyces stellatus]
MNWTGGNLHRHARGRGWSRDRSRQKQVFASVRTGNASGGPIKGTTTDKSSPFFSIGALKGSPQPSGRETEVTSPPRAKRRKTSPELSHAGDDLEARRRRLLERPDWTGICSKGPLNRDKSDTTSPHFEPSRRAILSSRLHHPIPVRSDGVQLVQSLESHTYPRSEATSSSRRESSPSERAGSLHTEPHPYPSVAASAGTAETEETDNLLPLSDTLPDVSVRLDILDPAGEAGRNGPVSCEEDDVSMTALLSSLSDESVRAGKHAGVRRQEAYTPGRGSQERMDVFTPERNARDGKDKWLDFIFEDGEDEEELMMQAFEVATRDAARALVPSVSSAGSRVVECDSGSGCRGSDRATCGAAS